MVNAMMPPERLIILHTAFQTAKVSTASHQQLGALLQNFSDTCQEKKLKRRYHGTTNPAIHIRHYHNSSFGWHGGFFFGWQRPATN